MTETERRENILIEFINRLLNTKNWEACLSISIKERRQTK